MLGIRYRGLGVIPSPPSSGEPPITLTIRITRTSGTRVTRDGKTRVVKA